MAKAEFVMLAQDFDPKKHQIRGQFISEKLDGIRAIWDGGVSRGIPASEIPWANTEKHHRFKSPPISTGLWTRYGQPIQAPANWLNKLPPMILDGELYMGLGKFQETLSVVRNMSPYPWEWNPMRYMVFDLPRPFAWLNDRDIDNPIAKFKVRGFEWWYDRANDKQRRACNNPTMFKYVQAALPGIQNEVVVHHTHIRLSDNETEARYIANKFAEEVVKAGGEGAMIRYVLTTWLPERTNNLLKIKLCKDMEGEVVGYTWGEETDKGSKLLGLMGSIRLRLDTGLEFSLSGFTDEERAMKLVADKRGSFQNPDSDVVRANGVANAGQVVPEWIESVQFPRGSRITFTYRELTRDGLPKEARYKRSHPSL